MAERWYLGAKSSSLYYLRWDAYHCRIFRHIPPDKTKRLHRLPREIDGCHSSAHLTGVAFSPTVSPGMMTLYVPILQFLFNTTGPCFPSIVETEYIPLRSQTVIPWYLWRQYDPELLHECRHYKGRR